MPLMLWATHVLQWTRQRVHSREGELTPKTRPQFRLQATTRLHEAGIASLIHIVRHTMGAGHAQVVTLTTRRGMPKARQVIRVKL
ncbi:hypothetical protein PVK06_020015 [Gossypium arboreum]|uniref:Uncharacterized protein n=1 Tax=Gossypium arboreum TaxID=29729 RepID=A0ABR0PLC6_GOSAR|nr:hypothetical protein PVK06_020015 [Gossypium arboreum]